MTLRILVTGSRDWTDPIPVQQALEQALTLSSIGAPVLVHGAARGADTLAERAWKHLQSARPGYLASPEQHPANWTKYGKAAGPIRNAYMVNLGANVCLTFARPGSVGTFDCARKARMAGIRVVDWGVSTADPKGRL